MLSFIKNKPEIKEKNTIYIVLIVLLSLLGISLLMLPVIVNFLNRFSTVSSADDMIYYILRGLFGVSIGIGAAVYAVKKDISIASIPCFIGFVTVLFPLYDSVAALTKAHSVAQQLSMSVGYGPYLITIGEYLLFTLLCLFTMLYSLGLFKQPFIIILISVVATLATLFTVIDKFITYDISTYEILSFAYAVVICIIPLILVLSATPLQTKSTKYKARRMR